MESGNFWRFAQNAYESSIRFCERHQGQGAGYWIWGISAGLLLEVVLCEGRQGQGAGHRFWEVAAGLLLGVARIVG